MFEEQPCPPSDCTQCGKELGESEGWTPDEEAHCWEFMCDTCASTWPAIAGKEEHK